MRIISEIRDTPKVKHIVEVLFKKEDIKVSDININDQNKLSYIHFEIPFFDKNIVTAMYTTNNFANDEIDDIKNGKIIEIFGINPDAIIKSPIEYKEIKDIYLYFGGSIPSPEDSISDDDLVFFCFNEELKSYIIELYNNN